MTLSSQLWPERVKNHLMKEIVMLRIFVMTLHVGVHFVLKCDISVFGTLYSPEKIVTQDKND